RASSRHRVRRTGDRHRSDLRGGGLPRPDRRRERGGVGDVDGGRGACHRPARWSRPPAQRDLPARLDACCGAHDGRGTRSRRNPPRLRQSRRGGGDAVLGRLPIGRPDLCDHRLERASRGDAVRPASRTGAARAGICRDQVVVAGVAAFVAWLGASLVVLGDGRRALAFGVFLAAAGMTVIAWQSAGPVAAAAIATGGALAAVRRFGSGPDGWRSMPPGSTPRLVLCVAGGLIVLWVAAAATTAAGAPLRFTVMVIAGFSGARVL